MNSTGKPVDEFHGDQGVDLKHLAKTREGRGDARRVDEFHGETSGCEDHTDPRALRHPSEGLLLVKIDAGTLLQEIVSEGKARSVTSSLVLTYSLSRADTKIT